MSASFVRRIPLALIAACCASICCPPGYAAGKAGASAGPRTITATGALHATGPSAIHLPPGLVKDGIDGVVLQREGRHVPAAVGIEGNDLLVTPCSDLEPGADYDVKVFTGSGTRYLVRAKAEEFSRFDPTRENTLKMPAKHSAGFKYAYYLYVPANIESLKERRLLVNCDNDAVPCTFQPWVDECAKAQASDNTVTHLARQLQTPCLVPAFPREDFRGDEGYVYSQILNRGAVQTEKVDMQLLAMIRDAQRELAANGIRVADRVFMYGFSTDAKFAQRFTVLHPEMVMATAAGGIAGTATFPVTEYKGEVLRYPVGVADVKALTGAAFNKDAYAAVPQYFFMGETDHNDATEYRDCYTEEDAQQMWRLFGRRQMPDRWAAAQQVLAEAAPNVTCKTYPGVGHDITSDIRRDVTEFYRAHWTR